MIHVLSLIAMTLAILYTAGVLISVLFHHTYPTALIGYISGPVRLEDGWGHSWYAFENKFLFLLKPRPCVLAKYAITHIQYRSRFGFYLAWPMCFYFWIQWNFQHERPNPNALRDPLNPTLRIPGTERGVYIRLPGWRWEGGSGEFIATKGYIGGHFD